MKPNGHEIRDPSRQLSRLHHVLHYSLMIDEEEPHLTAWKNPGEPEGAASARMGPPAVNPQ